MQPLRIVFGTKASFDLEPYDEGFTFERRARRCSCNSSDCMVARELVSKVICHLRSNSQQLSLKLSQVFSVFDVCCTKLLELDLPSN